MLQAFSIATSNRESALHDGQPAENPGSWLNLQELFQFTP